MTDALGAITSFTYTKTGKVETVKDAFDGVRTYQYDLLGRLVKETNELGKITKYTYFVNCLNTAIKPDEIICLKSFYRSSS
jgi:uncharacterized protein RhaS with RHS repeats